MNKFLTPLPLAALLLAAAVAIRAVAQSAGPVTQSAPTNSMAPYLAAIQEALVSGTAATNLSPAAVNRLMNESIKTNLAAQLWFRSAMIGQASSSGARMTVEIRALESLRKGRTKEAIRDLEDALDGDIILLSEHLRAADRTKTFKTTPKPLEALRWAKKYRQKYPYKSGNPATDDRVKNGLSYLDNK